MAVCYISDCFIFLSEYRFCFRDLGSTDIGSLPVTLIHNNTELRHLRLEANDIEDIPSDFFKYSQKLTSLILDHNQFTVLKSNIFHPLQSLNDIHLQQNTRFEMYCDYDLGNSSLFPKLTHIYMHDMAHQCIQPWLTNLEQKRTDLTIQYDADGETLNLCPLIEIEDLPDPVPVNTSLLLQFKGSKLFIQHKAYWISHAVDKCSDFRDIHNFGDIDIGHDVVAINDDGKREFIFNKKGTYILIYKYGKMTPFLPYYKYIINIV